MAERDLVVRFIGDDRQLQQAFTRTDRQARAFSSRMEKVNQTTRGVLSGFGGRSSLLFGSGAFIGGAAIATFARQSITAASDLEEQMNKVSEVFGRASDSVLDWSETTADSMGIAQREALAAAGTFGNLFRVIELAPTQAAAMSQALVQLAADLASFNNATPEDVLVALRSGLIGEAEPLRRYGVLLSEARVQQVAMAQTGKENVKSLTDQEKALARYEIIVTDTASAQGDFARTSGSLANQARTLNAQIDDLSASLGSVLVPALTNVTRLANAAANALQRIGAIDVPGGSQVSDIFGWVSGWRELDFLLDQIEGKQKRISERSFLSPDDRAGPRGPGGIAADNLRRQRVEDAKVSQEQADRFSAFIKGQELKLDRAGLTASLEDDLQILRAIQSAIQKRIDEEGRTFVLMEQLTDVQLRIASITERQASAEERTVEAAEEAADKRRKAAEERRRRLAQRQQTRSRGDQFAALGLTRGGDERVPGVGALRRRLGTLRKQVEGSLLDTNKTGNELDRIAQVLSGKFGKVGRDVRRAILDMLNGISEAMEGKGAKKGPLTKTRGLNTAKFLEGLGLTPEQERELRGRLSGLNTAGGAVGGLQIGARPTATTRGIDVASGAIRLESHTTINLDGKQIAKVITKQQQKDKRRNPAQKRGPNRGGI